MRPLLLTLMLIAAAPLPAQTPAPVEMVAPGIPAPPPGKGQVVFYRIDQPAYRTAHCPVSYEGEIISSLKVGERFVHVTDPGSRSYSVKTIEGEELTVEVKPGETLFVRCHASMGLVAFRPHLTLSSLDQFTEKQSLIPLPPPGKGQVVFFRPGAWGGAISCAVSLNGARLSSLRPERFFIHQAEPGPRTYSVESEAKDELTLEVEPGETQYVRCRVTMGVMVGRPNLSPATAEEFAKAAGKLKAMDPLIVGDPAPAALPQPAAPEAPPAPPVEPAPAEAPPAR
jgi:hypothetical protein